MKWIPLLQIPYQNPRHRSESINIGELYDFMYVLEERSVIDINRAFLGDDPDLEAKIRYLGKVTNKARHELSSREEVLKRFSLEDKKIILISLGRNSRVLDLSDRLLDSFERTGINRDYQVVMVLDPYLDNAVADCIRNHPLSRNICLLPFVPDLVDLVGQSEMVISRAGYNTVNEILLTGTKAVLIPESHGGGEQELRVRHVPRDQIKVITEEEALSAGSEQVMLDLLHNCNDRVSCEFDKYAVGKAIIEELEEWKAQRKQ